MKYVLVLSLALTTSGCARIHNYLHSLDSFEPGPHEHAGESSPGAANADSTRIVFDTPAEDGVPPGTEVADANVGTAKLTQVSATLPVVGVPQSNGSLLLGTTVASLGSPAEAGVWLKTSFVDTPTPGRMTYNGQTFDVELRPSGGEPGSGSQLSLAAMRGIGAPITDLVELVVFRR